MKHQVKSGAAHSPWTRWLITGAIFCSAMLALRYIAPDFAYDNRVVDMPVLQMVVPYCLCGLFFFLVMPGLIKSTPGETARNILLFVIITGIVMRLLSVGVPAIIEDDFYRYLWDGAVTAAGENPFRYSPEQLTQNPDLNSTLKVLMAEAGETFNRINHPEYSTVYPPVAQGAFALAHYISPYSLDAWRIILLLCELGVAALILGVLHQLGRSPLWLSLYWWNPVVIKEIANSGHMEPVLLLPVLAACYLVLKKKHLWVSVFLAIGAGVKVWPALLTAPNWRQVLQKPKILIASIMVFVSIFILFLWPILVAGLSKTSGFVAFGSEWNASSAIYIISYQLTKALAPQFLTEIIPDTLIARGLLGGALLLAILVFCYKKAADNKEVLKRMFLILAVMYILSPSQTPWYFIWLAPFLCFFPVRGLLIAIATLPLHYVYHYLAARDMAEIYHYQIVWFIWLPVWALLLFDLIKYFKNRKTEGIHETG